MENYFLTCKYFKINFCCIAAKKKASSSVSMRRSAFAAVVFVFFLPLPLEPSIVIFLNSQQLAGRKPAERGLIVVLELHVSFVTMTENLPGAQSWDGERGMESSAWLLEFVSELSLRPSPAANAGRGRRSGCGAEWSVFKLHFSLVFIGGSRSHLDVD